MKRHQGEIFRARHFITSGLNPQQTFLDLMDEAFIPKDWREKAKGFRYNLIAPLFGLNLNLNNPPQYKAAVNNPDLHKALMVILGLDPAGKILIFFYWGRTKII